MVTRRQRILTVTRLMSALLIMSTEKSLAQDWVGQTSGSPALLHDVSFVGNHGWAVGRAGTIVHSSDGGITWTPQSSGTVEILHGVSFVDSMTGWVVGEQDLTLDVSTVLHTTDAGNTWLNLFPRAADYFECHFLNHTTGWLIGGGGRIQYTTDAGATWTLQREVRDQLLFGVHFLDDSTGFIAGQTITAPRIGVMLSTTNAGATWIDTPLPDIRGLQSVHFRDYSNGWAVGWLGEMIRTTDGGVTWFPQESGRTDELLFSVFFNTSLSGWVVGGESGCQLINCDSLQGEQTIMLHTTDGGESWATFSVPVTGLLETVHFTSLDLGWIVGGSPAAGTVLRTTNGSSGVLTLPLVVTLVSPEQDSVVAADSVTLRWNEGEPQVDRYWVECGMDSLFVGSVADSMVTDTVRTVPLSDGTTYFWRVRAHNAAGWGPYNSNGRFSVNIPSVHPISCDEIQGLKAQCLTGSRLRITVILRNTSRTGETMTATVDENPHTLLIAANGRAQITVRSTPGPHLVELTDPAACFSPITATCEGQLAGSESEGTSLFQTQSNKENGSTLLGEQLPQVTSLLDSYPNPFNPRTTIAFDLASDEFVELRIYDLLGREVTTLINEILPAGTHTRQWDASDQSTGVYFYHFRVGEISETRKLLLMK